MSDLDVLDVIVEGVIFDGCCGTCIWMLIGRIDVGFVALGSVGPEVDLGTVCCTLAYLVFLLPEAENGTKSAFWCWNMSDLDVLEVNIDGLIIVRCCGTRILTCMGRIDVGFVALGSVGPEVDLSTVCCTLAH